MVELNIIAVLMMSLQVCPKQVLHLNITGHLYLLLLDIMISQDDVASFLNTLNISYVSLMNYSAVLVFSMETHSQVYLGIIPNIIN